MSFCGFECPMPYWSPHWRVHRCSGTCFVEKMEIALERVHSVITGNASNMAKAMCDASLVHFGCFCPFSSVGYQWWFTFTESSERYHSNMQEYSWTFLQVICCISQSEKNPRKPWFTSAQIKAGCPNKVELYILHVRVSSGTKDGSSSICCWKQQCSTALISSVGYY